MIWMLLIQYYGQMQIITLQENMKVFEILFGPEFKVLRANQILHECSNILTIDVGYRLAEVISKYQVWIREACVNIKASPEGEQGFEDISTAIWTRHSCFGTTVVTP